MYVRSALSERVVRARVCIGGWSMERKGGRERRRQVLNYCLIMASFTLNLYGEIQLRLRPERAESAGEKKKR